MQISRRTVIGRIAPAVALGAGVALSQANPAAALPVLYMDRMVVQAQVEPWKGSNSALPGDPGVKLIQQALRAKFGGLGVDGHFGAQTRDYYSRWQRSLGYSGLGANGIPGPTSLTKLGSGRFTVDRKINVGGRTTYSGVAVNQRTANMLAKARSLISWDWDATQGGYRGCSAASACTHAGGGAVDIVLDWGNDRGSKTVRALRTVGFAAWLRTPAEANWITHIHAIAIGDTDVHREAADQVGDLYIGRNGLASHRADTLPSAYRVPFTWWEAYRRGSK